MIATIPELDEQYLENQLRQYPSGKPGMSYFTGPVDADRWVDCLLWRCERGVVRGVLNHFPFDIEPEQAGNFLVLVDPAWRRQGIGTALVTEGMRRWGLDFAKQKRTPSGAALLSAIELRS